MIDGPLALPFGQEYEWHGCGIMVANLQFKGDLPTTRTNEKMHEIRRQFHGQLRRLWDIEDALKDLASEFQVVFEKEHLGSLRSKNGAWIASPKNFDVDSPPCSFRSKTMALGHLYLHRPSHRSFENSMRATHLREDHPNLKVLSGIEFAASPFTRGAFSFLPLATKDLSLMCRLEIKILRHDGPGSLFGKKGDIDNRVKALVDSLRVPDLGQLKETRGSRFSPGKNEVPFYCLLEDDVLVSSFEVSTEQWLDNPASKGSESYVDVNIRAIIRPTKVTDANRDFLGGWL